MDKNTLRLGQEKIFPLLIRLSIPTTFAMFINALYNIVDAIFVGRGVSTDAIGGLAIAFPVQMIILATGFLIGIGASSVISRSLGAKDYEKAKYALGNALFAGFLLGIIIVIFFYWNLNSILGIFGATQVLRQYAYDYLSIILSSAVFFILAIISNNIIRAQGNARMAMTMMVSGAVLNIILDPIFIYIFKMGIKGAALATAISQVVNLVIGLTYIFGKNSSIHIKLKHVRLKFKLLLEMIAIGFSAFIRQVAGSVVVAVLNNVIKITTGDAATLYISIFGIVNRVLIFMILPMFGVVQAFLPIAGFNFGAKNYKRVKESVDITLILMIFIGVVTTSFALIFTKQILNIFTDDPNVLDIGPTILRTVIYVVPLIGFQIVSAVLYQALGKARPALFLALLRQLIILIPLLLVLPGIYGVNGIWLSFPLSDAIAVIISFFMLRNEVGVIKKMQFDFVNI